MDQRRIGMADLIPGEPLRFDICDAERRVLYRRGEVVDIGPRIAALIEQGLFASASNVDNDTNIASARQPQTPSVLHLINLAHRRLEHLLFNLTNEPDAQNRIFAIAHELRSAVDLHPDIALACILLNQDQGSYAVRHCIDTAVVAMLVARALEQTPSEIQTTMAAALTMNVSMLRNHDQFQNRLNAISGQELAAIQGHPEESVAMLKQAGIDDADWLSYVLLHHENEDGSGYPLHKMGDEIPLNAKIISLADRYCARVSSRSYRKSLLPNEALSDILLADHQSVDPMLTACFIKVLGTYPIGAIVRLQNGEIGVVVGKGQNMSTPVVHTIAGPNGVSPPSPARRDTAQQEYTIREMLSEGQAGIRFSMQQLWG